LDVCFSFDVGRSMFNVRRSERLQMQKNEWKNRGGKATP